MIYQVERIVRDVRICLDENREDAQLFASGDEETLRLDEIIRSRIVEAVDMVHVAAPYYLLHHGHSFHEAPLVWGDMESGWVLLPDDFLRMVVFEMDDWERPVYTFITPLDPLYKRQSSRIKALRGTTQRPVCVVAERPVGKVLEFYSCKSEDAVIEKAEYIPYAEVDDNGGVDISERCYDAVVWMVAGGVLTSMGEAERAGVYYDKAKTLLQK